MCLFLILVPLPHIHMHTCTSLHPVSSLLWLPKSLFPHEAHGGGASSHSAGGSSPGSSGSWEKETTFHHHGMLCVTGLHSWILRNRTWQSPEHNTVLGKLQWKCRYSPMANTPEKLRDWKQPLKAFNSCRQTQSIIALWSCVWWEEHHWELNAIILCKCHGRRLHVVKFFCLKCNIYESHHFFISLQVDTIDHYILEIKSKLLSLGLEN